MICGDGVDNDCDGRLDEELCDGYDRDGDGRINEDCSCGSTERPVTQTTTTTATTPRTTTTTPYLGPVGECTLKPPERRCGSTPPPSVTQKVNIVFVVDWTTVRLPTRSEFNATSTFLQRAIQNWLPGTETKFGVVTFSNGVASFLQYLTENRNMAITNIEDRYRYELITNVQTDLPQALRFVRSHMFTQSANADADAKKIVIVLALAQYGSSAVSGSVRWETTMLANEYSADVHLVGLRQYSNELSGMAANSRFVTDFANFEGLYELATRSNTFIEGLGITRSPIVDPLPCVTESPFRNAQVCYGSSTTLECPVGQQISVVAANYGRVNYYNERTCGYGNALACDAGNPACPYLDIFAAVFKSCNFRQSCFLSVGQSLLGETFSRLSAQCSPQATYIDVAYLCVDLSEIDACSFSPASRILGPSNEFRLSASSSASCPTCNTAVFTGSGARGNSPSLGNAASTSPQCDASNFCPAYNDHCRPMLATFENSALEAWCPSLTDVNQPWITADLGAPYVVLGVVLQGRRRYLDQFVTEVIVLISDDDSDFRRVSTRTPRSTFDANTNSTGAVFVYFETATNTARFVKVLVTRASDHPALHLEVIIHNRVHGCEAFRGQNTNLQGRHGTIGVQQTVRCLGATRTRQGQTAYTTNCRSNGYWTVEESCS